MPGNRLRGRSIGGISQELLALLMFHDYPGNIRELENIIEHVFMLYREGKIEIHCLPENLWLKSTGRSGTAALVMR
jgi:transcriptional regulator with PAS, ATPase and Fis domain